MFMCSLLCTYTVGGDVCLSVIDTVILGPCASDPCQHGGTCDTQWINTTYAAYNCNCVAYYTGVQCEYGNSDQTYIIIDNNNNSKWSK